MKTQKLATLSIISRKDLFAIMAVVDIAIHGHRPLSADAIAAHQGTNPRFFEAALRHLKDCDILRGHRGKNVGGYTLARASNLISVADVVLAMSKMREGAHLSVDSSIGNLAVIPALAQAEKKLFEALERISIRALARRSAVVSSE